MDKAPHVSHMKNGSITFPGAKIKCTIRSLSFSGASLELTSPIDLPDQFTLVEEDKQHRCAVVWRKERRVGVAFY
jgi:hypothetical protein